MSIKELKLKILKTPELKNYKPEYIIGAIIFLSLLNERGYNVPVETHGLYRITESDNVDLIREYEPYDAYNLVISDIILKLDSRQLREITANISRYKTSIFWKQELVLFRFDDIRDLLLNPSKYESAFFNKSTNNLKQVVYSFKKIRYYNIINKEVTHE